MSTPKPENLIGLPLSVVRHATDLLNLQFGQITRKGTRSWGQYALHIQAPWRIIDNNKILVGRADHWNPVEEITDRDKWYESPHPSLEDKFWEEFIGGIDPITNSFEGKSPRISVRLVKENSIGDLNIEFSNGFQLQVFGCGTDDEFWRLLEPGRGTDHYVIGTEE
ncbi:MAG: hypothetical protein HZB87_05040 [Desulfatitalea sp.]|nr:hypothetical protein [Desulfatitalea sp.]